MEHFFAYSICVFMSILGGMMTIANLWRGLKSTLTETGTVLYIERSEDGDGVSFRPIVEFESAGEKIVLDQLFGWGWRPRLKAGDNVTVYFPLGNPKAARLSRWAWPEIAIPALIASVGICFGGWMVLASK